MLAKSELSKDKEVLLRNLFQENAAKEKQVINAVKNSEDSAGAVTIANRYEADLKGFEEIFLKSRKDIDGALTQMDSLGATLDEELGMISKMRVDIEASLATDENNGSFQIQSHQTIQETQDLISKTLPKIAVKNKFLSADEVQSLAIDLDSSKNLLDQARNNLGSKKFGAALIFANQAYRYIRAAEVFISFTSDSK